MELFYSVLGFLVGFLVISLVFVRRVKRTKEHLKNVSFQLQESNKNLIIKEKNYDLLQAQLQKWLGEAKSYQTRCEILGQTIDELKTELIELKAAFSIVSNEKVKVLSDNEFLRKSMLSYQKEQQELQEKSLLEFENIAQKLLEEKSDKFTKRNKENIEEILRPLNENIFRFKKQVEETYDRESKMRFSLDERIKELMAQTSKISTEANNLVHALKSNHKKQGDWGEVILESILEKSGLIKNREYRVQQHLVTEEGKYVRPDIIVDLPESRSIVIDSKVSLNAYNAYCNSDRSEDQQVYLKNHLKAIRNHIEELSSKNYHELVNSLDFTMLFIPIEPAYLLAIHHDPELWNDAYQKRILLISPTNLIACLKLIVDLWNREKQDKSAQKIVKQAEKVYDKIFLFVKSFEQIGKQLEQASATYRRAENQLKSGRGNVLTQTQQLLDYGIAPKKDLNEFRSED